jgi:uncharacterized protein YegL
MGQAKCRECNKTRDLREPCPRCGDPPCAAEADPTPTAVVGFNPADFAPRRPAPLPEESLKRFAPLLDESPVFQNDMEVVQPLDPHHGLAVGVDVKFEVFSAPADAEPVVNLLLTLLPEGPPLLDPKQGPVAHVVIALDLSASMNHPDKYPVLTEALAGMLYDLRSAHAAEVLVSVVAYAYGAETLFHAVPSKSLDPREVLTALDRSPLRFGRYTDMAGALRKSGLIAKESLLANRAMPVRIYLLTDGKPQDVDGVRRVLARIAKMPVDLDAIAFGGDADVSILQELVSGGRGGTVKHVRADTLSEAFGRIGEVAQRVVANRALFDLELAAGVVGGEAFRFRPARHRYGDTAFEGGTKFSVDLGSLESGRPYTLLFELRLPRAKADTETEVGRMTLRLPGFGGPRVYERHLALPRHSGDAVVADAEVLAARDVLAALGGDDPQAMLKALRVRRRIYEAERRDTHVLGVIDKAIAELEERGSLKALSAAEHAALLSHTCTVGGSVRTAPKRHEPSAR